MMRQDYCKNRLNKGKYISNEVAKATIKDVLKFYKQKSTLPLNYVLDVGSGTGLYTKEISKYAKIVVAVEPFKEAYEFSLKNIPSNVKVYNNKVEEFDTPIRFDLVLSLTTIEHMDNVELAFKRIFKLLRHGGILYVTAPNKLWPYDNHYRLPFLTWLPLNIANAYMKLMRRGDSYEDSFYSKSYFGMKRLFNSMPCWYEFVLPDPDAIHLGCNTKNTISSIIRSIGIKLIRQLHFFWIFSKGFIVLAVKK